MSSTANNDDNGGPLPLSELKEWMSESVFAWIKEGDLKQEQLEKELEETAHMRLFGEAGSDSDDDDDDDDNFEISIIEKEKIKKRKKLGKRIRHWSSSIKSPDGVGGFQPRTSTTSASPAFSNQDQEIQSSDVNGDGDVQIVYILSDSYEGFGDILWSSARYVANTVSNPITCRELLSPLFQADDDSEGHSSSQHPLEGRSFLEVGAGAGVPSWAAMKCGANIVCTDLADTNRIRSLAECVERNIRKIREDANDALMTNASKARVCPHDWGSPIDGVLQALNSMSDSNETNSKETEKKEKQELFDVIIAADCCYMPWFHKELLDSMYKLLSERGIAIVAFALHGNTDDEDVWKIVDRAKQRGFLVEVLDSQQLSPPYAAMESKQGLVHIVRLTKPC